MYRTKARLINDIPVPLRMNVALELYIKEMAKSHDTLSQIKFMCQGLRNHQLSSKNRITYKIMLDCF